MDAGTKSEFMLEIWGFPKFLQLVFGAASAQNYFASGVRLPCSCANQEFYFFFLSHRDIKNTWCDFMLERKRPFVCLVNGAKEISIENYGSLGDFSDKKIVLNCYKCKIIIEGEGLLIEYFTDVDMKITGHIHSIHF